MIRRKFMKYAPKEHSDEKVKANLQKHNVPVFEGRDPLKFAAYSNVAKDITRKSKAAAGNAPEGAHVASAEKTFQWQQRVLYGGGGGGSVPAGSSNNPYAVQQPQGNPYASDYGSDPYANPYASPAPVNSQPAPSANPITRTQTRSSTRQSPAPPANPYGGQPNAYASQPNAYGSQPNAYASAPPSVPPSAPQSAYGNAAESNSPYGYSHADSASDLNAASIDDGDLNSASIDKGYPSKAASTTSLGSYGGANTANAYPTAGAASAYPKSSAASAYGGAGGANAYAATGTATTSASGSAYAGSAGGYGTPSPAASARNAGISSSAAKERAGADAIRSELFGSAPQRLDPDADEFDELNRTTTELRTEDDFDLNEAGVDIGAPQNPEDELNALPSDFAQQTSDYGNAQGYYQPPLFEDSEDEEVEDVKREIRQTKQESVESTRRALQIAREAEISGTNALGMLGNQGERLGMSAKTVQLGNVQARVGDRNADELIRLNRSIFIPNISNPFNSRRRNQLKEQRLKGERAMDELEAQQLEAQQREADRRIAEGLTSAGPSYSETVMRQRVLLNRDNPQRKMYQFEADSDDEALEDELATNLDEIANATNRLHNLSLKISEEVDDQNRRIDHMGTRVDILDTSLLKSTAKMSSIT